MIEINWILFLQLLPFTTAGLAMHVLDKWDSARTKDDYSWKEFKKQNLVAYINATIATFIGLALMAGGVELVPGALQIVVAFGLGFGGGSLVRSFTTKFLQR